MRKLWHTVTAIALVLIVIGIKILMEHLMG